MTKKKIIISILVILFLTVNVIWGIYMFFAYKPYADKIKDTGDMGVYSKDGYTFSVSSPQYLSFSFNLAITEDRTLDRDMSDISENTVDLLIWIEPFSKKEYGIDFFCGDFLKNANENYNEFKIMVDASGKSLDVMTMEEEKIYKECEGKIEKLFNEAEEVWGIK